MRPRIEETLSHLREFNDRTYTFHTEIRKFWLLSDAFGAVEAVKLVLEFHCEKVMEADAMTTVCTEKKNKRIVEESGKRKNDDEQEYEVHLQTERERRKKMKDRFTELHALLPHIAAKAGKSAVVEEATEYIKTLEETVKKLEAKKQERKAQSLQSDLTLQSMASQSREEFIANYISSDACSTNSLSTLPCPAIFHAWTSSNVTLSVCGSNGHISICSPRKPRIFTSICFILEKRGIEVVTASICSCADKVLFNLLVAPKQASGSSSNQVLLEVPVEETFRQAAEEIILWVTSLI